MQGLGVKRRNQVYARQKFFSLFRLSQNHDRPEWSKVAADPENVFVAAEVNNAACLINFLY